MVSLGVGLMQGDFLLGVRVSLETGACLGGCGPNPNPNPNLTLIERVSVSCGVWLSDM